MNTDIKKRLGKKIKALRRAKKFTQEEVGEKAGINYKFFGQIERGEVNPSLDSLIAIARALDINIRQFFPEEDDPVMKLSSQDFKIIKKALKLMENTFSQM